MATKSSISKKISDEVDLTSKDSKIILNYFISFIKNNCKKKSIKIVNFGTFYKNLSPKRIGRNPLTKETYPIPPQEKIKFKASYKVKEILNWYNVTRNIVNIIKMKIKILAKFFIVFSVLFIPFLITQESSSLTNLDEDYLDSLPESVRDDVIKEMDDMDKDKDKNLQKRPSSKLSKIETVREWENFKKSRDLANVSERFGIKIFNTMQSSFMPLNEPNFGNNYFVDYGDFITVHKYSGNRNEMYELEISRDGTVILPDIGKVFLAGLNFDQAAEIIKKKYEISVIGVDIFVTLSEIRDINVLVTGNVEFPGVYTLSGNSNILQALNIVGGVTENGSLRNILLKRKGEPDQLIDLYDVLIFGEIENIPFLKSGDSIHIQAVNNLVRAGYGFNNVATYELFEEETIADLVRFAGGLKPEAKNNNLKLVRLDGSKFKTSNVALNNISEYKINNLDSIYAYKDKIGTVTITGDVKHPGKYSISSSDRMLDIIERSGGYIDSAYPFAASLQRESAKDIESAFASRTYQSLISYIASNPKAVGVGAGDGLTYILSELKDYEPVGRYVAEFDITKLQDNIQDNIYLNDGDNIHIPSYTSNVYVLGEVGSPGSVMFKEGLSLSEYIEKSGGYTRYSSVEFIFIVSPNGETAKMQISGIKKFVNQGRDIYPGSVIYTPRHIDKIDGVNFYATIAPIFSSLALSLASLNSISD